MAADHPTEAACLLEQGALYRRRIGLRPLVGDEDPIFAGFKQGAFSLYFGDAPIFHFDLEGRWQRAFVESTHYLKGLDAIIHAIDRVRDGPNLILKRRTLTPVEADDLDARIRSIALELLAGLDAGTLGRVEPAAARAQPLKAEELRAFLARIGSWDFAAWLGHRKRFHQVYGPLPFLPPECQNAVVLQATVGQATGAACGGALARETHTRSPAEFSRHAEDVSALWGLRLLQSRNLFLAGSDVLHQPVEQISAFLSAITATFPIVRRAPGTTTERGREQDKPQFDGVHAFMDNFALPRPDCDGWRELAARGLVRISLDIESGDREVRRIYHKDWADEELRATVADCKAAALGVSVLTLVGAGGIERAEPHIRRTSRLIDSLELGAGDFVFLLDEKEMYEQNTNADDSKSLMGRAWTDQQAMFKEALAPLKKKGIKVLPYTMEKQWT